MTSKPNGSQMQYEVVIDQFYQQEKQVEKKQVSVYLDTDVIEVLNEFGKDNGKGAKSKLINNFLKEVFNIRQGQQVAMPKTAEQILKAIKEMDNEEHSKLLEEMVVDCFSYNLTAEDVQRLMRLFMEIVKNKETY